MTVHGDLQLDDVHLSGGHPVDEAGECFSSTPAEAVFGSCTSAHHSLMARNRTVGIPASRRNRQSGMHTISRAIRAEQNFTTFRMDICVRVVPYG